MAENVLDMDYLINYKTKSIRYLEVTKFGLPSSAPRFVEDGRCQWCNKELSGRARLYCQRTTNSIYSNVSDCAGYFFNWWFSRPAYVRAIFIRDDFTCQNCGVPPIMEDKLWLPDISQLECDHINPIAKGGITEMDNLQTLCRDCNRRKGVRRQVPEKAEQLSFIGIQKV